jgi:hypothetical protein
MDHLPKSTLDPETFLRRFAMTADGKPKYPVPLPTRAEGSPLEAVGWPMKGSCTWGYGYP